MINGLACGFSGGLTPLIAIEESRRPLVGGR
jgi:hypothetical protein